MENDFREYKLRSECNNDILNLLNKLGNDVGRFECLHDSDFPDRELTFESKLSYNELQIILSSIVDSHVMKQTLQPTELYDGRRNYLIR